jgi:ketosteroid isomerase-like protein
MSSSEHPQRANVELVRKGLETYNSGDLEAVRPLIDPEGEVTSNPLGMNRGIYKGFDGYMKWLRQWLEAWEEFEIEIESVEPIGERHVVVDVRQFGLGKGSGVPVEQRISQMWEIRDGKVARFHLYPEHAQARAAAELGEQE